MGDTTGMVIADNQEVMGGVTCLVWQNEAVLISGHRQDKWLRQWDIRYPAEPLARVPHGAKTNQRLHFSCRDSTICYGNDDGKVSFKDGISWQAHANVAVTAAIHPKCNLILTSGGTRTFPNYDYDDLDDVAIPPVNAVSATPPADAGSAIPPVDVGSAIPPVDAGRPPVDVGGPPVGVKRPLVDVVRPPVNVGSVIRLWKHG